VAAATMAAAVAPMVVMVVVVVLLLSLAFLLHPPPTGDPCLHFLIASSPAHRHVVYFAHPRQQVLRRGHSELHLGPYSQISQTGSVAQKERPSMVQEEDREEDQIDAQ
jgi:hypothetical protein